MRSSRWLAAALAVAALAAAVAVLARGGAPLGPERERILAGLSVTEALGGGALEGFARAEAPRAFDFPRDHGPHPEFRTEWWYYTGNLHSADGRAFGFQLTFFRTALAPRPVERGSAWATTQVYLGHFALTDVRAGRFRAWSRTGREALGLAGARARPYRVWIDDWIAEGEEPGALPMRLRASDGDVAIDVGLGSGRAPVLQGDGGWSRKGSEPGNASYYYSLTRMPARGTIRIAAERVQVEGLAWMDREWSTSALSPGLAGWDWFALQLDDGRDLMLYRLRGKDGTVSPWSAGSLVEPDGRARALTRDDVAVQVLGTWTSPRSGVTYPARWRLIRAASGLVLELAPRLADQELDVGFRYWEGAVSARGTEQGRAVSGLGYVELVGYEKR